MLPIHQEENKERFKFQEKHSWAEVFYDIQTRGLDLVYAQCKAERWEKPNDLFL